MLLKELFNTATTKVKVIKQTPSKFGTSAMIKDREIRFYAVEDTGGDEMDVWMVSFGEVLAGQKHATADMTGSGGELEVLSMVKDSMKMFVDHYQPGTITFTADKGDRSRASVYERMLKRMLPSPWKFEKKDVGGDIEFILTKPKA